MGPAMKQFVGPITEPLIAVINTQQNMQRTLLENTGAMDSANSLEPELPKENENEKKKICKICGDNGFMRCKGVMTCESCRGFYRSVGSDNEFRCRFYQNCNITILTRNYYVKLYCEYCRYQKCLSKGMPSCNDGKPLDSKCPHCNYISANPPFLKRHIEAHERFPNKRMYECDVCKIQYGNRSNLIRHRVQHKNQQLFQCKVCGIEKTRQDTLLDHQMTHIKKMWNFECPACDEQFSTYSNLMEHLQDTSKTQENHMIGCKKCRKKFPNLKRLQVHFYIDSCQDETFSTLQNMPELKDHDYLSTSSNDVDLSIPGFPEIPQNSNDEIVNQLLGMLKYNSNWNPDFSSTSSSNITSSEASVEPSPSPELEAETWKEQEVSKKENFLKFGISEQKLDLYKDPAPENLEFVQPSFFDILAQQNNTPVPKNFNSKIENREFLDIPSPQNSDPYKDLSCTTCGITFKVYFMYDIHANTHSPDDPLKCGLCGIQFQNKYEFTTHMILGNHSNLIPK
ncbi:Protein CBG19502 [Caenorhabditis briggsae]|uniref:Protein CBG19502 n=1 Tax=Caenorhabditis briggsae TaxID=6238 RepID=A8XVR9_CAEBR|nr:Protein CBG19502 [Caenorhabditis briggsae]CAP36738.2 Protein CBG19502 [Caenorhabditis briggsae]